MLDIGLPFFPAGLSWAKSSQLPAVLLISSFHLVRDLPLFLVESLDRHSSFSKKITWMANVYQTRNIVFTQGPGTYINLIQIRSTKYFLNIKTTTIIGPRSIFIWETLDQWKKFIKILSAHACHVPEPVESFWIKKIYKRMIFTQWKRAPYCIVPILRDLTTQDVKKFNRF